jgi:purine-binding chemotaxis protein CheW
MAHNSTPPLFRPMQQTGLLVDEIGDVLDMDAAMYERTPENLEPAARELIRGVYKLKDRLLLVLDAERTVEPAAGIAP